MTSFDIEIPISQGYNIEKFYEFVRSQNYEHIVGALFSKENIIVGYIDKDLINGKIVDRETPVIFISGEDMESPLVQKIINEARQI